jgi:hypothetical protein
MRLPGTCIAVLTAFLLLCRVSAVAAAQAPSSALQGWNDILERLRAGAPGPYAVYLGSPDNRLPRLLAAGAIATLDIPVVVLRSGDQVRNPMTDRLVGGERLQNFFGASAGTLLFLDADGMPIPQLSIPQAMHGNDPELFTLYFGYVAGAHYKAMSIAEYCRALGKDQVVLRALRRVKNGFSGREFAADEALLKARNHVSGESVDPWADPGVFHIYTADAAGRVFRAQVNEIERAFGRLNPRFTLIVPDGEEPDMARLPGVRCVLAHAARADLLRLGASPLTIITAGGPDPHARKGIRLDGFQPADVVAKLVGLPLADLALVDHDIPYAEMDEVAAPAGGGASETAPQRAPPPAPAAAAIVPPLGAVGAVAAAAEGAQP